MRVLITGGHGQLATDLIAAFADDHVEALPRESLDITNARHIDRALAAARPDVVMNTAAYHQVDRCEREPEMSFLVNAAAPQRLAAACEQVGAQLIHFSTDYVFDGETRTPYREHDPVHPLSVYGSSKAAGEMAIRSTTERHTIIRTTGLYGLGGRSTSTRNFVETMLRLAATGHPITVVADQVLTPTSTLDLASITACLVRDGACGTFHVTNSGACSWYEFAAEIFRQSALHVDLRATTTAERPVPARRPAYSVLAHQAILQHGLSEPRPWQEALAIYLQGRTQSMSTGCP